MTEHATSSTSRLSPAEYRLGVHGTHCCLRHGCKYGDADCPVKTGETPQVYPCEECGEDERPGVYEPSAIPRWYWAIFKDVHILGGPELKCEIETQWFDTIEEAQSQMWRFDRDTHRIHGVLRSDDD